MNKAEIAKAAKEYRQLQVMIKELEAEAETLRQSIISSMDQENLTELAAGEYTIHWNLYESSRLDTARLKKELPDLYGAYIKRTVSTRFQVA
ncbi:MAG: hypothetical protein FWC60_12400 [Firmicutes bacterium]|nr:hypothetical protein [Bacillota bacterium]